MHSQPLDSTDSPPSTVHQPPTTNHQPLFLIGYRGTGKTAVAKLLAERLGWQSLDADKTLQERQHKTVSEIFAEQGEAAFRDFGNCALTEFCSLQKHVIATGGGIILSPENRKRLRDSGTVVWLKANAATISHRLQDDQATASQRPPLTLGGLEEIKELLKVRGPLYKECATFAVDTAGQTPEDVVAEILTSLSRK